MDGFEEILHDSIFQSVYERVYFVYLRGSRDLLDPTRGGDETGCDTRARIVIEEDCHEGWICSNIIRLQLDHTVSHHLTSDYRTHRIEAAPQIIIKVGGR